MRGGAPKRAGGPPGLGQAALRLLLPRRIADQALGDLEEEYRLRLVEREGVRVWYWSQVLRSVLPALRLKRAEHRQASRKVIGMKRMIEGAKIQAAAVSEGLALALRGIRRFPGFTLLVVATLALGLGANATIFSVVDRLLLRPPDHLSEPDGLVQIYFSRISPFTRRHAVSTSSSYPDFVDLHGVSSFASVAGYSNGSLTLGSGSEAERIDVQRGSGNLFETLGVRPHLGRFYQPSDDAIDGNRLMVLSHAFWTRRFGADPAVLGRTLQVGKAEYEVVGVAPRGFTGPTLQPVDLWLPLLTSQAVENGTGWREGRRWYWFSIVARLAEGVSSEAARSQATATHLAGRSEEIASQRYDPEAHVVLGSLVPGRGPEPGREAMVSLWLAGVALLVLLVACANVANLLLARGIRNRREWAVRKALGISTRRMVGVLLIECSFLALLAAAAAVAVSVWSSGVVYSTLLPHLAPESPLTVPRVLLFTGAAGLMATLLAGLIPALQASRVDPARDLTESRGMTVASGRVRAGLMLVQVGLSVVLLAGAGLFLRSLMQINQLDLGFQPEGVVVASVETAEGRYNDQTAQAVREGLQRLQGAPGVSAAALSTVTPFRGLWGVTIMHGDGSPVETPSGPFYYVVTEDYFKTMGMRVVKGRGLDESDMGAAAAPVTVLTQDLARRAFPQGDALGKCIKIEDSDRQPVCTIIVGILADHRSVQIEEDDSSLLYLPVGHPSAGGDPQHLLVKSSQSALDIIPLVRGVLLDSSADIRYVSVDPVGDAISRRTRPWRLGAVLFSVFGALALLVASLGLYALFAFDVTQKRRELAIRGALGAGGLRLMLGILRRALVLTALGTAVGLAAVYGLGGYLQGLLFRVQAVDPWVLGLVALTLALVALAASAAPALRASRVPLAEVLRAE